MNEAGAARRVRNPRGRGEALRTEIITATGRLLDAQVQEIGLPLSLREVARAVGIAAQSIYLQFADKEQLALAVSQDGYGRLVVAMRAADEASAPGTTPGERLRVQAHEFLRFARANRGVFQLMVGYDTGSAVARGSVNPARTLWDQWMDAVTRCQQAGECTGAPARQQVHHLWAGLLGGFVLGVATFGGAGHEVLDTLADQLVDRMLAEPGTVRAES